MRLLTLSLIFLTVGCAHSRNKSHDDFDDSPRPKREASATTFTSANAAPPTSLVVTDEGDDGFEETKPVSMKSLTSTSSASDARDYDTPRVRVRDYDAPPEKPATFTVRDVTPNREELPGRGVPIIVERPTTTATEGFPEVKPRKAEESRRVVSTAEPEPREEPKETPAPESGQAAMMGDRDRRAEPARTPIAPAPENGQAGMMIAEEAKAKLDRDIAAINGTPLPPAKEPERETPKKKQPKEASKKEPEPDDKAPFDKDLEQKRIGLSILVGAGGNVSSNSRGGFTSALAYGGTIAWNPSFAGPFGLDVSFWRSANTSKASSFNVAQDFNHFAVRLLVTKSFSKYFFSGFGGGFLLTRTSASYSLNGAGQDSIVSAASRPGIDGTVVAGVRAGYFETRLDLRALGRGMNRLDFLPTLSLGATF